MPTNPQEPASNSPPTAVSGPFTDSSVETHRRVSLASDQLGQNHESEPPSLAVAPPAAGETFERLAPRSEQSPAGNCESVPSFATQKSGTPNDSPFWNPADQKTLAVLLIVASLAILIWSGWQAAFLRARTLDVDKARRTPLRFVVDVNTAPAAELANLPGVGPKLAEAIVAHRQQFGNFQIAEDLLAVNGIGPSKLRAILPYLRSIEPAAAAVQSSSTAASGAQLP